VKQSAGTNVNTKAIKAKVIFIVFDISIDFM